MRRIIFFGSWQKSLTLLLSLYVMAFIPSCSTYSGKQSQYWSSKRDQFMYANRKEFISDTILEKEIKKCVKSNHKPLDSLFQNEKVYLYSWQQRDSAKKEFTVVYNDGELGLKVYYLIFDDSGLRAFINLAGAGKESYYVFDTRSKFISRDTIFQMKSITKWPDVTSDVNSKKTVGDTTFLNLIINADGSITQKLIKEVKALNFNSD